MRLLEPHALAIFFENPMLAYFASLPKNSSYQRMNR